MTTVSSNYKSLVDVATDGGAVQMIEVLQRRNPLIELLPWVPTNDGPVSWEKEGLVSDNGLYVAYAL